MEGLRVNSRGGLSGQTRRTLIRLFQLLIWILPLQATAAYMTLSSGMQSPPNKVAAETPVTYTLTIENEGTGVKPDGASGVVETYIAIFANGYKMSASGLTFSSPDCVVDADNQELWSCPNLSPGQSQELTFTWEEPWAGYQDVEFRGTWNFVAPHEDSGLTSSPESIVMNSVIDGTTQTIGDIFSWEDFLKENGDTTRLGISLRGNGVTIDHLDDNPITGETGFKLTMVPKGDISLTFTTVTGSGDYFVQIPVEIEFELPMGGLIAPEEKFTVSTDWSTPNRTGRDRDALQFRVNPTSFGTKVGSNLELDLEITTRSCWQDSCENGKISLVDAINEATDYFELGLDFSNEQYVRDVYGNGSPKSFLNYFDIPIVDDPLEYDVLRTVSGKLAGLSSISIPTDLTDIGIVSQLAGSSARRRGGQISAGWDEFIFGIEADLTNIAPLGYGLKTGKPIPPLNGTLGDLAGIFLAYKEGPYSKVEQRVLNAMYWLGDYFFRYSILEIDISGSITVENRFNLAPKAPEIRIKNGTDYITGWFRAGEDFVMEMPSTPTDLQVEVRGQPSFSSSLITYGEEVEIVHQPPSWEFLLREHVPENNIGGKLWGSGKRTILGVHHDFQESVNYEFEGNITLPNPRTEPHVGLSGGGGIAFGGGNCWQPDNLPPDTPSGIQFDENEGCLISLRDLGLQGQLDLASHSDTEIAMTLLNTTLFGNGGGLADVVLDPNGGTSIKLRGETSQPGLDSIDLFFDDAGSSGNHNRVIVDTQNGAFIRNSLFRGLTSNENQSDIILQNGRLWIENTHMTLDNLTVQGGSMSIQDSTAALRNLQVGGGAESAMRLTRDTLITTTSNASFNSSNLEIGNGSLVNVSGLLSNQGLLALERGGWLTVLEGDNPSLPDRLGGVPQNPGTVDLYGFGIEADADAALALVPDGVIDPMTFFNDQVMGTRLDTGVLLLSGGEIENNVISNAGGTMLLAGGAINQVPISLSDEGWIIVTQDVTEMDNSTITGTGHVRIDESGTLVLDGSTMGDGVNDPFSLVIDNQGLLHIVGSSELTGNVTLINVGTLKVDPGQTLTVEYLHQPGSTLIIDGTLVVNQPLDITAGVLLGSETIVGNVINKNGKLTGEGLTINGAYYQGKTGDLELDLATYPNPQFTVGDLDLNGRLTVIVTPGFLDTLVAGTELEFLFFDSITGVFSGTNVLFDDGSTVLYWGVEVIYGADSVSVRWVEVEPPEISELPIHYSGFEGGLRE